MTTIRMPITAVIRVHADGTKDIQAIGHVELTDEHQAQILAPVLARVAALERICFVSLAPPGLTDPKPVDAGPAAAPINWNGGRAAVYGPRDGMPCPKCGLLYGCMCQPEATPPAADPAPSLCRTCRHDSDCKFRWGDGAGVLKCDNHKPAADPAGDDAAYIRGYLASSLNADVARNTTTAFDRLIAALRAEVERWKDDYAVLRKSFRVSANRDSTLASLEVAHQQTIKERDEARAEVERLKVGISDVATRMQGDIDDARTELTAERERLSRAIKDLSAINIALGCPDHANLDEVARSLVSERDAALKAKAEAEADAARFRWLLDGHGYFMEEEQLCGHPPCPDSEKNEVRKQIDAALAGVRGGGK
jgi:hypothetical protein